MAHRIMMQSQKLFEVQKIAYIQRSRGCALRPAFTLAQIEKMAQLARSSSNPDIIVRVDNCYGEFTDTSEPVQHGAEFDDWFDD